MTNEDQMLELLREIRDLQTRHFEHYKNYTECILEIGRQQELERQQREEATRAEYRRSTHGLWSILAVALFVVFLVRPIGDWLLALFDR